MNAKELYLKETGKDRTRSCYERIASVTEHYISWLETKVTEQHQALQLQQINIMQSICEESVIVFAEWLRENSYDTGNKWLYQKNDELYTSKEIYEVYRKECSEN